MKYSVALLMDGGGELRSELEKDGDFAVVAETSDGDRGLAEVLASKPDVVILDLVLKGMDGLTLLTRLKENGYEGKRAVYSACAGDETIRSATRLGADLYLVRPLRAEIVVERIKALTEKNLPETKAREDGAADLRISNVFLSAGIPPHIKGYGFLRSGVKLAMKDPAILGNITKQLYPTIAREYGTSPSKVERAIRHAIEVAWNRGRIDNLNSIFGVNFYKAGDKPTNGEFIALVADRLIQEQRMGKLG